MSLFPAYSDGKKNENCTNSASEQCKGEQNTNLEWLKNSSYEKISSYLHTSAENGTCANDPNKIFRNVPIEVDLDETTEQNESCDVETDKVSEEIAIEVQKVTPNLKNKNSKSLRHKIFTNDLYFEDRDKNTRFCRIDTLERSVRPNYKLSSYKLYHKFYRKNKQRNFQRYYMTNVKHSENSSKTNTALVKDNNDKEIVKTMEQIKNSERQNELKTMTEEYNKKLAECPTDINSWLDYVSFQDKVAELSPFRSEKKNSKHLMIQKKLSIVEKALTMNRNSVELLKMKLQLMSELLPADQFSNEIEAMIQKDSKNIVLWEALIMVIQTSIALCKVSKVLSLYAKCIPILKEKSKSNPKFYEKQALGLLYQCLTFLRNVGLWEQMWETIRLNLCLNLTLDHETLKNLDTIDEQTVINMEEIVLTSKLPLNQLWLRIEALRESCHWCSVNPQKVDVNLIGDEKRLITAEEINDFIYPTISRESNFQLVILSLLCLKVPLLPSRHCTLQDFKLEEYYWNIDSLEFILPMIYSTTWVGELNNNLSDKNVITDLLEGQLTSGPQFLKYHPAKETFLDFIRSVFNIAAQNLPKHQKDSIFIWWMKFERFLIFFNKHDRWKESDKNKKLKSLIKNFLKKPENRNNLHFYREFALIERELGAVDNSIQILKTAILSQDTSFFNTEERTAVCSLYRTILEILFDSEMHEDSTIKSLQEIIESFKNFISKSFIYDLSMPIEDMLYNEILKFLINPVSDELEDAFLLPHIHCDLLICYSYLIFMKNKIDDLNDIIDLFNKCIEHCDKCYRLKERFYESKVVFLQFYQHKIKKINSILKNTIDEAILEFPSNFFLLSINASIESELPYWKLKTNNNKTSNIWSIFSTCLAGRARIAYLKNIGVTESVDAMVNKMLSFHRTISRTKQVQGNPLVWRFYMLLLRDHNLCEKKGEEVYYEAINQCPWVRSVYINAAEIAPQILSQIQDLMKEKEIRIHVTPEELEILRE